MYLINDKNDLDLGLRNKENHIHTQKLYTKNMENLMS